MAAMEGLITGALAQALEAGRDRFNDRFDQARRANARLDPAAFGVHLQRTVSPIVEAVHRAAPERTGEVAQALFDLSVELVGQELIGPWSRYPVLQRGWHRLLEGLPHLLAQSPRLFAGLITNALYNLAVCPNARPLQWIEEMRKLGEGCLDFATFQELGKVVAWRCGLAHYREGALAVCEKLEPALARAALGIPDARADGPIEVILGPLRADAWRRPASIRPGAKPVADSWLLQTVGGFRGFGGQLLTPPTVTLSAGQFLVIDQEVCWSLHADVFGATLLRAGKSGMPVARESNPNFHIDSNGRVTLDSCQKDFPELANATSFAANPSTLAVTLPLSHSVYLIALTVGEEDDAK